MQNKTIIGLVIAVLVIGGVWYFASNKQEAKLETTKVKIASLPNVQGLPVYVAIEKGYFKDAGW
jgi:ABC-type nitrate/sulfonate/bicarbonate transport system substrate-binding protein